jgi:hypothetical protein
MRCRVCWVPRPGKALPRHSRYAVVEECRAIAMIKLLDPPFAAQVGSDAMVTVDFESVDEDARAQVVRRRLKSVYSALLVVTSFLF